MSIAAPIKISFLIPAYNEAKLIRGTLLNLRSHCDFLIHSGIPSEIVVCNNNSTDDTAKIASEFLVSLIDEPVNQIGRARNRAASVATGDWFIFVDADTLPSRELILETLKRIQSGDWLGGGTTMQMDIQAFESRVVVGLWNIISRMTRFAAGAYFWIERDAFRSLGGFNQAIFAGEEIDLSSRAKALARKQGKRWGIINSQPVKTSGRKFNLYSFGERLKLLRFLFHSKWHLLNKKSCDLWYDGRR